MSNHLQQPPQPSSGTGGGPIVDDDAEIQEALNDVAAQLASTSQPHPPPKQPSNEEIMFMQAANRIPQVPLQQPYYQMVQNAAPALAPALAPSPPLPQAPDFFTSIRNLVYFSEDLKLMAVVFFVVFAVHFIPLESIVGKYIAIERIPYHDKLLRAIVIAVLVVVVKNLFLSKF
jgi:hypothetical protein